MSDLLSGLEAFGIKGINSKDMFVEEEKEVEKVEVQNAKVEEFHEADALFDKNYECPICEEKFAAKTIRTGRTRAIKMDVDLRPMYEPVDGLKYDAILCPHCGYAALSKYFGKITNLQRKNIKETICVNFKKSNRVEGDFYTYDEAIAIHKVALANAIAKKSVASEKAFICLKIAWLFRGKMEHATVADGDLLILKEECEKNEREFLQSAYEGFTAARQNEMPPICGMDDPTLEYLLAVNAMKFGDNEIAAKLIGSVLISTQASSRLKDKARDLKQMLIAKIKEEADS